MPTLLMSTAPPAGPAAPGKLACREIAHEEIESSAADTQSPETGPVVEHARIRPLPLLSSPPAETRV